MAARSLFDTERTEPEADVYSLKSISIAGRLRTALRRSPVPLSRTVTWSLSGMSLMNVIESGTSFSLRLTSKDCCTLSLSANTNQNTAAIATNAMYRRMLRKRAVVFTRFHHSFMPFVLRFMFQPGCLTAYDVISWRCLPRRGDRRNPCLS